MLNLHFDCGGLASIDSSIYGAHRRNIKLWSTSTISYLPADMHRTQAQYDHSQVVVCYIRPQPDLRRYFRSKDVVSASDADDLNVQTWTILATDMAPLPLGYNKESVVRYRS